MIGLIQKILMNTLEKAGGDILCNRVLESAGVERDRQFRIDMNYSDAECLKMFSSAKEILGCSSEDLFDLFAKEFVNETQELFSEFYTRCSTSEEFLRSQIAIHALVGSSLRNSEDKQAVIDKFQFIASTPGYLMVRYSSPNRLCGLYRALAQAVADYYGDNLTVETRVCGKQCPDKQACEFCISWQQQKRKRVVPENQYGRNKSSMVLT